jgi:hypothetical protein
MPPYRANLGGAFGSGRDIRGGSGNIDIASAIREVGNQASSLIQSAYLRKIAEVERVKQANAEAMLRADKQAALTLDAQRRAEDVAFRKEQLQLQRDRLAPKPEAPKIVDGQQVKTDPSTGELSATPIPGYEKPQRDQPTPQGTFDRVVKDDGSVWYFYPSTGKMVPAPAGTTPRNTAVETGVVAQKKAVLDVRSAINRFRENVKSNGVAVVPGVTRSGQDTDYRSLLLKMKEMYNLGVLNGPDLALMEQIINPPASWGTLGRSALGRTDPKNIIMAQLDKLEADLNERARRLKLDEAAPAGGGTDRFGPRPPGLDPNDPD